ncbi:Lysosomal Pro-X carboxypeptidase [Halotydeus destructor]|nr:Lysosomal Pro-X carboxypeptidase [Halotydeus destructor]
MKETCKKLTKPDQPDRALLRDIYGAISVFYNYTGSVECNSIQPDAITTGWDFQTCTEMVMPVCSNSRDDIFPLDAWNFTQFSDTCYKTWKTKPDPLKILTMYGGKDLKAASNIIFSNGDRDPWSVGGVQVQVGSPSVHIITVPHGCHHEDLRPTGPNDPPELRAVREKEAGIIRGWIEEYYKSEGFLPDSWKNVKFV